MECHQQGETSAAEEEGELAAAELEESRQAGIPSPGSSPARGAQQTARREALRLVLLRFHEEHHRLPSSRNSLGGWGRRSGRPGARSQPEHPSPQQIRRRARCWARAAAHPLFSSSLGGGDRREGEGRSAWVICPSKRGSFPPTSRQFLANARHDVRGLLLPKACSTRSPANPNANSSPRTLVSLKLSCLLPFSSGKTEATAGHQSTAALAVRLRLM